MQADKNIPGQLGAIIEVGISACTEVLMPPLISLNKIPDICIFYEDDEVKISHTENTSLKPQGVQCPDFSQWSQFTILTKIHRNKHILLHKALPKYPVCTCSPQNREEPKLSQSSRVQLIPSCPLCASARNTKNVKHKFQSHTAEKPKNPSPTPAWN